MKFLSYYLTAIIRPITFASRIVFRASFANSGHRVKVAVIIEARDACLYNVNIFTKKGFYGKCFNIHDGLEWYIWVLYCYVYTNLKSGLSREYQADVVKITALRGWLVHSEIIGSTSGSWISLYCA